MISVRSTSAEIDDIAAEWVARNDAGSLTDEEQQELKDWCAADVRHMGAFFRAQAIFIHTERAGALSAKYGAGLLAEVREVPVISRRILIWGGAAAAASLMLAAVWTFDDHQTEYVTRRGEIRTISLDDGSVITLNTASSASVRYTRRRRQIEIFEGEALFDVAEDARRPFRVILGNTEVLVLGTQFSIRHLKGEPSAILVEKGVVDVVYKDGVYVRSAQLTANMRAISVSPSSAGGLVTSALDPSEVKSEMAWRQGMLAFRGTSLADAVRQFDRYGDSRIVIADPAIGQIPITGLFSAHRPRDFIETIALSLDLRLDRGTSANFIVVRRAV